MAVSEAFPTGALEGARLHWGAAPGQYRTWQDVPSGWSTEPGQTKDAGAAVHQIRPSPLILVGLASCAAAT